MTRRPRAGLTVLLTGALAGCGDGADVPAGAPPTPAAPVARFHMTDVTADSGLDFVTTSGHTPAQQIVDVKGGGLALIDFDDDDDLDLFIPNGATLDDPEAGPGCRLYENLGAMRFRDATADAGLALRRWAMGVATGDYDGDGHDDLYVSCFGPDVLLRNGGDGTFRDVTAEAGIAVAGWSTGCAFGDLDGDGDLDLYVARYIDFDPAAAPPRSEFRGYPVFAGPRGLPPAPDVLLENLGDGTFRDATASSGAATARASYGLGALIVDLDGDGRQDVFVGNDSEPNFLFRNRGGLRFDEVGSRSGLATTGDGSSRATMGIALGDVDGDGRPDVFTTNFAGEPNTLHLTRPGGFHDDGTRLYGAGMVGMRFLGWACAFHDLDHDGAEDLLVFNGHVYPQATPETMMSGFAQPPLLLQRDGDRFARVTAETGGAWLNDAHCDRTAVFGDLDGDGDVDVVVAGLNEPVRLLRNDGADGAWLIVEPAAPALGARIEVHAGDRVRTRWIASGTGYLSASAPTAHFGLGPRRDPVDVVVRWADGVERRLEGVPVDRALRVDRPGDGS
jgi:hypothetical protein